MFVSDDLIDHDLLSAFTISDFSMSNAISLEPKPHVLSPSCNVVFHMSNAMHDESLIPIAPPMPPAVAPIAHQKNTPQGSSSSPCDFVNLNTVTTTLGSVPIPPQFNKTHVDLRNSHIPMLYKEYRKLITTCVSVFGINCIAVVDTASQISFLHTKIYTQVVNLHPNDKSISLQTPKQSELHVAGNTLKRSEWAVLPILHGNYHSTVEFDVNTILPFDVLLGLNCLQELAIVFGPDILQCTWQVSDNILTPVLPDPSNANKFSDLPNDAGRNPAEDPYFDEDRLSARHLTPSMHVNLSPDYLAHFHAFNKTEKDLNASKHKDKDVLITHPSVSGNNGLRVTTKPETYKFIKQYKIPQDSADKARTQILKTVDHGSMRWLTPADGNKWNHPLLVRPKKDADGTKTAIRICSDLRHLNSIITDSVPDNAPDVDAILKQIGTFAVATQLDCASSFHQFPVHPDDQHKLAFTLPGTTNERFTYVGAPFGLKSISAAFQALIEYIFAELPRHIRITLFIDDITVLSNTLETHAADVHAVLVLLNKYNVKLNLDKCRWCVTEFALLGYIVSSSCRRVDFRKLEGIINFPILSTNPASATGSDIRHYLGLVAFFRQFIPAFSQIAAPLFSLTGHTKPLGDKWSVDAQTAFQTINHAFLGGDTPVLRDPLPHLPLHVATDASHSGVGGVLYQENGDGTRRFICFASKALGALRSRHGTTQRELLGITTSLKTFRHWIWGRRFTLHTDHMALTYLFSQSNPADVITRYHDIISDYTFRIQFCSGSLHILPDHFSRIYTPVFNSYLHQIDKKKPVYHFMLRNTSSEKQLLDEAIDQIIPPATVAADQPSVSAPNMEVETTSSDSADTSDADEIIVDVTFPVFLDGITKTMSEAELALLIQDTHVKFGHLGTSQVTAQFRRLNYHWPNMITHVHGVLQHCAECQTMEIRKRTFRPLQHIEAVQPFDHIAIDLAQFPTTPRDNTYLLVIVDVATKFVNLHALTNKSATTVAAALLSVFALFGFPQIIQSDNGTEFANQLMAQLSTCAGWSHRLLAPYHPQGNGIAERQIRTVKQIFLRTIGPALINWDLHIPQIHFVMNRRLHGAHHSVPAELMFARSLNPPDDYRNAKASPPLNLADYLARDKFMFSLVYPEIFHIQQGYHALMSTAFEKSNKHKLVHPNYNLAIDDIVYLLPQDNALGVKFCEGPYVITAVTDGKNYTIMNTRTKHKHARVHISRLKIANYVHPFETDDDIISIRDDAHRIDHILDYRFSNTNGPEYLVRWHGYTATDDEWLMASHILTTECIQAFWLAHPHRTPDRYPIAIDAHTDSSVSSTDISSSSKVKVNTLNDEVFYDTADNDQSFLPPSIPPIRQSVAQRQSWIPVTDPQEQIRSNSARWEFGENAIHPEDNILHSPRSRKPVHRYDPSYD